MKLKLPLLFLFPATLLAQVSSFTLTEVKSAAPPCPSGNEITSSSSITYEQEVLELLNDLRNTQGLAPLKLAEDLTQAARYHAKDMVDNSYFSHPSQSGCTEFDRIGAFYTWQYVGENIASYYQTPATVMQAWEDSPGHYANMVKEEYREIGIGYYTASGDKKWVQDFGRRSLVYPVVINREDYSTSNPNVDLYIYGDGIFDEMRIKNDGGAWTSWQPFNKDVNWNINAWPGTRTVYVEIKHLQSGTIVESEDQIEYTGVASVEENEASVALNIFPNPMKENATVSITSDRDDQVNVILYDLTGRKLGEQSLGSILAGKEYLYNFSTATYPSGAYYFQLRGHSIHRMQEIIIQK